MMPLARRIAAEKRALVWALAIVAAANVAVYAFVVYPLAARSAGAAARASAAAQAAEAASREAEAARAIVAGKARADEELAAFYQRVLPADLSAARRLTYARLPALARESGVRYEAGRTEVDEKSGDNRFGRLRTTMLLQGEYENIRRFVYEVETAPEFVIIDTVTLAQPEADKPLALTLELSTYYRLANVH